MALSFTSSTAYGRACAARGASTNRSRYPFTAFGEGSKGGEYPLGTIMTIGARNSFV